MKEFTAEEALRRFNESPGLKSFTSGLKYYSREQFICSECGGTGSDTETAMYLDDFNCTNCDGTGLAMPEGGV